MNPVPTPRGTSPLPRTGNSCAGATARFCTITVAGRTLSATATVSTTEGAAALVPPAAGGLPVLLLAGGAVALAGPLEAPGESTSHAASARTEIRTDSTT